MGSRRQLRWVSLAAVAVALACAHPAVRNEPPPEQQAPAPRQRHEFQRGVASYYGNEFEGRRTASGVLYNSRFMTCAHRTLPFGTVIRVTDVETSKSVVVKVTDRGPYAKGRVVDLSLAAARKLGIVDRGLARVTVEIVQ
ncbi:MAG: septal ring lytic transglycosylase RlpA family protein [Deltaproteobacteria bacterium]|nr:MAG: septal ring lytic transglycosylase RlpA family protein [Deltaproteobacteria bacterium]TMB35237.1 MAG: septal ring lytic transglycosylase RlpA family protein [Deltaproteobacteria bacterium]